jgi:hypothetical protein
MNNPEKQSTLGTRQDFVFLRPCLVLNVDCVSGLFILDFVFLLFFFVLVLCPMLILSLDKRKTKSRMNNPEKQSTLGTRQGRRKTKEK